MASIKIVKKIFVVCILVFGVTFITLFTRTGQSVKTIKQYGSKVYIYYYSNSNPQDIENGEAILHSKKSPTDNNSRENQRKIMERPPLPVNSSDGIPSLERLLTYF